MNNTHGFLYFFDTDLRQSWFHQLGVSSGLAASQRLKDVCSRTIHFAGETQYALQKELL